jgi:putative DNA primase/helicase
MTPDFYDIERSFLEFAESQGFAISGPLKLDGRVQRFSLESDRGGAKSGAYCVWLEGKSHDGKPHGWVQDHHEGGMKHHWQYFNRDNPPPRERPTAEERNAARARREEDGRAESERRREAVNAAWDVYQAARPIEEACDHPYLLEKHVTPRGGFPFGGQWCGLRAGDMTSRNGKPMNGLLLIPMADITTGKFCALHRVFGRPGADGRFGKGWCTPAGGVFPIGVDVSHGPVVACEGISTALSVYDLYIDDLNTPNVTVLSMMDAGNLVRQAPAIRKKYSDREIFIAADADEAGQKAARAAMACGFNGVITPPVSGV